MSTGRLSYYVYVSTTKVEMLYSQIPRRFLDGLAAEFKVNVGVVSTALSQKATEETLFSKLRVVLRYIHEHENVGTIDNPDSYFHGIVAVRWGPYAKQDALVLFTGSTDRTIIGLGGSLSHVLGVSHKADVPYVSTTPFLGDLHERIYHITR